MAMLENAYGVQVFGVLFHLIAICTNGWFRFRGYHLGLFKICYQGSCGEIGRISGFFNIMRGMTCLGFLILLVAVIMATVYIFKRSLRDNKKYRYSVAILVLVGGIFAFIGPLVGLGKRYFVPDYSLYIAIIAGLISIVGGIFHGYVIRGTTFE